MFSLKSLKIFGRMRKQIADFVHTNKNAIYVLKKKSHIQKQITEKENHLTAECQSNVLFG